MVNKFPKFLQPTKKKIIITSLVAVLAVGTIVGIQVINKNKAAKTAGEIKLSTVTRGDIEMLISGSGTVEPYERYEVLALAEGEILDAPYEVGDTVSKGDILYKIDSSDAQIELQKQENSLETVRISNEETQNDIKKLSVTAACDGIISGLSISVGDEVKSNANVAKITNSAKLKVKLPFNSSQISNISVGQSATISSSAHMSSVTGNVVHIESTPTAQSDGSMLYNVTISFDNPGGFTNATVVGGNINGMVSPGSGIVEYSDEKTVTTETEGKITAINYKDGDFVKKGAVIATIKNDSINNNIRKSNINYQDALLSLENKKNDLDNYNITSPITGTVLSKEYKTGDTIDKANSSVKLMVVADISKLKFSLSIDELDIAKVSVGQEVQITCDAIAGETFIGTITNVSMEGTSSNGVTSYTADVLIENPGSLRPSMNVDASVVVESTQNALMLPVSAVKTVGQMSYVFLKETDTNKNTKATDEPKTKGQKPSDANSEVALNRENSQSEKNTTQGEPPQTDNTAESDSSASKSSTNSKNSSKGGASRIPEAPDGFVTQIVTTGISNDDYIEIISGLSEGDQVYIQSASSTSTNNTMGGMGMMGGGVPGGSGGAPSGRSGNSGGGGAPSGGGPRG